MIERGTEKCVEACVFRATKSEVKDTGGYNKTRNSPAGTISNQGIQRAGGYERRGEGAGERGQEVNSRRYTNRSSQT